MSNPSTERVLKNVLRRMTMGYFSWYIIYIVLGLLTVLLPILITIDAFGADNKVLPAITAIVAAVFAFLKPHEYATGYDAAKQEAWKAEIAYSLGQIDDAQVATALARAVDITTFKYGGKALTQLDNQEA